MSVKMKCASCETMIPKSSWKKECYPCYKGSPTKKKAKKYNPCDGCGGEDCQCCDYGRGY
jgi:hypothetical protein